MPYVAGETLRTRLEREHQLPVDDALRITREVADALGSAHAIGIVHRDIKPENILLQGGHALVADFGIALAVQQAGGQRMTQTGLSLGTPQYMAPEQAMGEKGVDLRADIYALGAVTYEMLTGEPPFTGSTVQAIVARVLTEEPRGIATQRKAVPEPVEAAVLRALEKLPADRPGSAAQFVQLLDGGTAGESGRATRGSRARPSAARLPVAIAAAACAVLGLVFGFLIRSRMTTPEPTRRQQVVLWKHPVPDGFLAGAAFVSTQAAIAPDGSSIVYADSAAGGWMLMRKRRESAAAEPLAGTEGGVSPFFSPDGKWLGFATIDGKIRKMPAEGGTPITVGETVPTDYKAAAWLDDNTIVYAGASLMRVSATGGAPPRALHLPERVLNTVMSIWPLPGSRGFLFTACAGKLLLRGGGLRVRRGRRQRPRAAARGVGRVVCSDRAPALHRAGGRAVRGGVRPETFGADVGGRPRHRRRATGETHPVGLGRGALFARSIRGGVRGTGVGRSGWTDDPVRLDLAWAVRLSRALTRRPLPRGERSRQDHRPLDPAARRLADQGDDTGVCELAAELAGGRPVADLRVDRGRVA